MLEERKSILKRTCGFRFSPIDGIVILLTVVIVHQLWQLVFLPRDFILLIPIVVGHFFLFCNILRLHRSRELLWTAIFLLNTLCWHVFDIVIWWKIILVQMPVTITLILWEIKSKRYHGIFSKRINPHIERYLNGDIV